MQCSWYVVARQDVIRNENFYLQLFLQLFLQVDRENGQLSPPSSTAVIHSPRMLSTRRGSDGLLSPQQEL